MGSAVALGDVVGERQDILVVTVVPFERDVDADAVAHRRNGDGLGEQRGLGAVEIFDEGGDPALVIKLMLDPVLVARIDQDQPHARIEEGELAVAVLQPLEVELGDLERVGARQEGDARTLLALGRIADDLERRLGIAVTEAHEMLLAVAPDRKIKPFGKRVDDADADAVQAAGNLVGIVVGCVLELTPRVELGHDDLGRRDAFLAVDACRDAAAVIFDRDRPVGVQLDDDPVAVARQRLVDRIVGNLEHHMVEARAVIGVADVHAGALAHCVEALENLDALGVVSVVGAAVFGGSCHSPDIGIFTPLSRARTRTRASVYACARRRGPRWNLRLGWPPLGRCLPSLRAGKRCSDDASRCASGR